EHSMGNATYGANGIGLWAHPNTGKRIYESYSPWQSMTKAAATAPLEKQLADAKSDVAKKHLQGDIATVGNLYALVNASQLALPDHWMYRAIAPQQLDLSGLP